MAKFLAHVRVELEIDSENYNRLTPQDVAERINVRTEFNVPGAYARQTQFNVTVDEVRTKDV